MYKTWNVRDQTEEELETRVEALYREIDKSFKLLKKISKLEDAKKMMETIWNMKKWANEIQIELLRRKYTNGETQ